MIIDLDDYLATLMVVVFAKKKVAFSWLMRWREIGGLDEGLFNGRNKVDWSAEKKWIDLKEKQD